MDLNEQLYCMFSSYFEPPVARNFSNHGSSHWHTAKVNKVPRISLIFSDVILTEDTRPEPEQLQLVGEEGSHFRCAGQWTGAKFNVRLDCVWRERELSVWGDQGGGHVSRPVNIRVSHTESSTLWLDQELYDGSNSLPVSSKLSCLWCLYSSQ